jgi:hypothetical protein
MTKSGMSTDHGGLRRQSSKLESLTNDEKERPKRFPAHIHRLEQTRLYWNTSGLDSDCSYSAAQTLKTERCNQAPAANTRSMHHA